MNKTEIIQRIREIGEARLGESIPRGCLYWAEITRRVLEREGIRALIQAGSLSYPCIPLEDDDGICSTHFSYIWEPTHPLSVLRLVAGEMPEMHVWAGIPATGEIVDVTTRYLPEQATRNGIGWRAPEPPEFLWCAVPNGLPPGVVYRPTVDAIRLALHYIAQPRTVEMLDGV